MTTETKSRKAPVTHKDLTNTYLMAAMTGDAQSAADALDPLLVNHTDAVGVLDKVINSLSGVAGLDLSPLEAKRQIFADAAGNGVRGRRPPKLGDRKTYSVQQQEKEDGTMGDLFIRLPLGTLGVVKGEKVDVYFSADGISVAKRAANATPDASDD